MTFILKRLFYADHLIFFKPILSLADCAHLQVDLNS